MKGKKWWLVSLISGPLHLLGVLFAPLYAVSLGILDKHLARQRERQLETDVNFALTNVLGDHTFRMVPNRGAPFPPGFDYAYATVAFDSFLLRFMRGRGELDVLIAPTFAPADLHDLSLVLGIVKGQGQLQRSEFRDVWDVARSLQPHLTAVIEHFGQEQFRNIKTRFEREVYSYERFANRQWETDINNRLYGSKG